MKKMLILLLAAVLLIGLYIFAARPAAAGKHTTDDAAESGSDAEETAAPLSFRTTDREGNVWDEGVFADSSLTMLNFWEPWCGPCVREMPDLQKLAETYADRGFRILGVYSTPGMEEDVDKVLESTGVTYPILHRTADFDLFQSGYVPTTVFVDAGGYVAGGQLYVGSGSYEACEALVLELLG